MNISVIGAGPIGSYSSYLLSKNHDVKIFEEHKKIGEPVQCTGIVTSKIREIIKIPNNIIVNRIRYAKINSPNGNQLKIKVNDLVIDRVLFDYQLAQKAEDNGVKLNLESRFQSYNTKSNEIKIKKGYKSLKQKTDILIGADGPNSKVREYITKKKVDFLIGKQALVKGSFDKTTFQVFFNVDGFFSWIVPENVETARVGFAYKRYNRQYDTFVKSQGKILSWQAGLIPLFDPLLKTQKDNIYVVGDAAAQVKASTGGGIVPGLIASQALTRSIEENKKYEIGWRKELLTELSYHKKVREILNKFTPTEYDELIEYLSDNKVRKEIENVSRDKIIKVIPLLLKHPKLLKFSNKLF